jgi:hypothetical protein
MVLAADLLQIPSRTLLPWERRAQPSVQLCQRLQVQAPRQPHQRRLSLIRLLLEPTHILDVTLRQQAVELCHRLPFIITLVSEFIEIPC